MDSNRKILVVTESPQIASIVISKLERDGFKVFWKSTAAQSIEFIQSDAPNLAILDSILPDSSGYELLLKIRANPDSGTTPIFILLDTLQERSAEEFRQNGAQEVILKPFRPTDLSKKVRKIFQLTISFT